MLGLDFFYDFGGHGVVDVAGEGDEFSGGGVLGEEPRINGEAVSADAGAGEVEVDAGVFVGEVDGLPDVDFSFFGEVLGNVFRDVFSNCREFVG